MSKVITFVALIVAMSIVSCTVHRVQDMRAMPQYGASSIYYESPTLVNPGRDK